MRNFNSLSSLATSLRRGRPINTSLEKVKNLFSTDREASNPVNILGIESSCDDTGAAVVNGYGQILGEGYHSQTQSSVKFGGVVPSIARIYHAKHIEQAVNEALEESSLSPSQLTAVAATVKPGLLRSLVVGAEFGKAFALRHNLPFIPIHHMEAHALTVRIENKVDFPFVVLLVSGGHCLLAVSHALDQWTILGQTLDLAPGCLLDRVARRLKLKNILGMGSMCGGRAIEELAKDGDPEKFSFPIPLTRERNANFSFSGFGSQAEEIINRLEKEKGIEGGRVLDEVKDLCASFQQSVIKHIVRRTHIGLKFVLTRMIPENSKTMVISGGVSSNKFLRKAFENLCREEGFRLLVPPPKLCTDNGIMVAWNGIERWTAGKGVLYDREMIKAVTVESKCPLGPDISSEFKNAILSKPTWTKLT